MTRMQVAAVVLGVLLATVIISWGKAIWQEFIQGIDDGFDDEARRQFPDLFDEDNR